MKVRRKAIDSDGSGSITFIAECPEDFFHTYNLLLPGDTIKASTFRKVVKESSTGSVSSEKIPITMHMAVLSVDFDPEGGSFRITGKNAAENKFIKMGQHHTIDLVLHKAFTITKAKWTSVDWDRIDEATNPARSADIAAVLIDSGRANVCLVSDSMTLIRRRINTSIPKKRRVNESSRNKAVEKFYRHVMDAIIEHVDFDVVKVVLVAGPGFVKDDFLSYMHQRAVQQDIAVLKENKSKFLPAHSPSPHVHDLKGVLADPSIQSRLADTRAAREVRLLDKFMTLMSDDPNRAAYGYNHVNYAVDEAAVDDLLVVDALFRSNSLKERAKYTDLVERAKAHGGRVSVFSSLHVSGQQLAQLTGVAALLRFPLPLDDLEFS